MALEPQNARLCCKLGVALDQLGQPDEALTFVRKACVLDPKEFDAWFNLASLLADKEDWSEAQAALAKALELRPEDVESLFRMGRYLLNSADKPGAAALFRKVLELQPDHPQAREALEAVERSGG